MSATIQEDSETVAEVLASALGAQLEVARGMLGYSLSRVVKREGETLARVLYGGRNGNPHVITTSGAVDDVVPVLRAAWADDHQVTRMDSAQDFDGAGAFARIRGQLLARAESGRLSVTEMQSTRGGVLSRTVYLGAPSSPVRVRLYEKGAMNLQNGDLTSSPDWVRLEIQVRPKGAPARVAAATVDPVEAWGFSAWTRDLARDILSVDVDRVNMNLKREPDYARALLFLERQYSATLRKALVVEGSWDAVGRRIGVLEG